MNEAIRIGNWMIGVLVWNKNGTFVSRSTEPVCVA